MHRRVWCCAHIYINLFFIFIHKLSKHTDRPTFDAHKKSNHDNETFCSFFNVFAKSLTVICTTYIHTLCFIIIWGFARTMPTHTFTYTHTHINYDPRHVYMLQRWLDAIFSAFLLLLFLSINIVCINSYHLLNIDKREMD